MLDDAVEVHVNVPPVLLVTFRAIKPAVDDADEPEKVNPFTVVGVVVGAQASHTSDDVIPVIAVLPFVPFPQNTGCVVEAVIVRAGDPIVQVPVTTFETAVPFVPTFSVEVSETAPLNTEATSASKSPPKCGS